MLPLRERGDMSRLLRGLRTGLRVRRLLRPRVRRRPLRNAGSAMRTLRCAGEETEEAVTDLERSLLDAVFAWETAFREDQDAWAVYYGSKTEKHLDAFGRSSAREKQTRHELAQAVATMRAGRQR